MKEAYLHYVWRTKRLQIFNNLETKDHKKIEILYPGDYNEDQGPDFNYAKISMEDLVWIGQIEMHVRSSQWNEHNHSIDPRYHNVILHVVWIDDVDIVIHGKILPTLVLSNYLTAEEFKKFDQLLDNSHEIPCENHFTHIPESIKLSQFELVGVRRLENKVETCKNELYKLNNNWEELYYRYLCRYMVNPPNAEAMECLLNNLHWKILSKVQDDELSLEAIFYGMAGFLDNVYTDEYFQSLKTKFNFLQKKFQLTPINLQNWYFLRLRPPHFPTIRIAQLANYFYVQRRPFLDILQMSCVKDILTSLSMNPSSYWQTHYHFDKKCNFNAHKLGESTKIVLAINVIIPLLYSYGILHQQDALKVKALKWLEELKPEKNKYTKIWERLHLDLSNAFLSQASIQQYKEYCRFKKCLDCKIGHHILYHTSLE